MRINLLEVGVVGLLLIAVGANANSGLTGLSLVIGHLTTLLALFILIRNLAAGISNTAASLLFALAALLLIVEASIQFLTGMHLNWFVLSLLLEGGLRQNTGLSPAMGAAAIVVAVSGLFFLSTKTKVSVVLATVPRVIVIGITAAVATQFIYAVAYYHGSSNAIQVRRSMPFFWTPHPYQSNKLLGYVFPDRGENPFSLSKTQKGKRAIAPNADNTLKPISTKSGNTPPNILIVVTDSLRSKDIRLNPGLAPSLMSAGQNGFLSLDHYSVSNCTHFSLYSMFTGTLPTGYGSARNRNMKAGMLPEISAAGYQVSSAESASLDWYDLSDIILPATAERWIGENEDTLENDRQVTNKTLQKLTEWQQSETPGLHLAYYHGTHFPYSETLGSSASPNLDLYKIAIGLFDAELAKILAKLNELNLDEKTLVIITSDHGEEFFENGRVGHASRLSDEQVQVPLLVLGAHDRLPKPLSHLDIPEFIYAAIDPARSSVQRSKSIYLANCGYEFPAAFSVINAAGRFDFEYDNGYLIPVDPQRGKAATYMRKAATDLLEEIR